jgi:hypothetical protein
MSDVVSHTLESGDVFEHKTLLTTHRVESVDNSGHVETLTHRGDTMWFDRENINDGIAEGYIVVNPPETEFVEPPEVNND